MVVAPRPPTIAPTSRWRGRPAVVLRLLLGLWLFGAGEGLLVEAGLGNTPWTVLAEGASFQTGLGVGAATIAISFVVLALWIPLRQPPGLGTLLNAVVIGLAIAATLPLLPDGLPLLVRVALMAGGIGLLALGSGLYLSCRLGPGPRDGLMTGLNRLTGRSIRLVRTAIEVAVVVTGFLLGGSLGVGTVLYALAIGPLAQLFLRLFHVPSPGARTPAVAGRTP